MKKLISHTAKPSKLTQIWHKASPLVPTNLKFHIRRNGQYLHSRHLSNLDHLLLSYPKSGSTWLRSMLLSLLSKPGTGVEHLANWIPPLHLASSKRLTTPRIVRSHDSLSTPGFSKANKTAILVRDPRALVVSYFYHQKRRDREMTIDDCAKSLLSHGFDNIGSWKLHVQQAVEASNRDEVKILKYEDLVENTETELSAIIDFFEITNLQMSVEQAVQDNSRTKLRDKRLLSGLEAKNSSDVRDSTADSWTFECPKKLQDQISNELGELISQLGYPQ